MFFPGGDFSEIRRSINKLLELDENIVVYPGHGGSTTVKEYRKDFFR
jgi:glyoxylase-like metal-dependent hydrolase (beta-lactamase superfamily II)